MSDMDTPSNIFMLATRKHKDGEYERRSVNMAFEKRHVEMFKIVPPCIGSAIDLECRYTIEKILYTKTGVIILYCIADF